MSTDNVAATSSHTRVRAQHPRRTLLLWLGVTLIGTTAAFLLSPVSPFTSGHSTVSIGPSVPAPVTRLTELEPVRLDRLDRQNQPKPEPTADPASATDGTRRTSQSQIGVQPAADQATFVPTPPTAGRDAAHGNRAADTGRTAAGAGRPGPA